jgi:hypothetical protein
MPLNHRLPGLIAAGIIAVTAFAGCAPGFQGTGPTGNTPLRVSPDRRWLVHADGRPFFYLGDTAWELFHRLNREEADHYLEDRASKGFTVIQAVVLAELDGLNTPNPYGHTPLIDNDPARPNEDYFRHVDHIVQRAEDLGIFIGMLPTWGDKFNQKWGVGPVVFTPENARLYGGYLGERYRGRPVVWILGGDRNPEEEQHLAIIRAMAEGIRSAVGDGQLMTYHPQGGSASWQWFHNDEWLDFNMFQSGHDRRDRANYEMLEQGYRLTPVKPVLDGEPRYEDHPVNWRPEEGWFDEFDVRQAAYWAMLSGAAGHTYGDHNIWQMYHPGRAPVSAARTPWREALQHPGATQMGYMRALFESRPYQRLAPDPTTIAEPGEGAAHVRAARADDGSFLLAYTPYGRAVEVDLTRVSGSRVEASWFDPRTGVLTRVGAFPTQGRQAFTPPGAEGRGNDWLLVLDDAARRFRAPVIRR